MMRFRSPRFVRRFGAATFLALLCSVPPGLGLPADGSDLEPTGPEERVTVPAGFTQNAGLFLNVPTAERCDQDEYVCVRASITIAKTCLIQYLWICFLRGYRYDLAADVGTWKGYVVGASESATSLAVDYKACGGNPPGWIPQCAYRDSYELPFCTKAKVAVEAQGVWDGGTIYVVLMNTECGG